MARSEIEKLTLAIIELNDNVKKLESMMRQVLKAATTLSNELHVLNRLRTKGFTNELRAAAGMPFLTGGGGIGEGKPATGQGPDPL